MAHGGSRGFYFFSYTHIRDGRGTMSLVFYQRYYIIRTTLQLVACSVCARVRGLSLLALVLSGPEADILHPVPTHDFSAVLRASGLRTSSHLRGRLSIPPAGLLHLH